MVRNSSPPPESTFDGNASSGGVGDLGFRSIRDRLRFKRNPNPTSASNSSLDRGGGGGGGAGKTLADRGGARGRLNHGGGRQSRRGLQLCPVKGNPALYLVIISAVFLFAAASLVLQSSIMSVIRPGSDRGKMSKEGFGFGTTLRFVPGTSARVAADGNGLDRRRQDRQGVTVRWPRLALVLGNMKKDPQSLLLVTVIKNIQKLGYALQIFAVGNGNAHMMWEQVGGKISILGSKSHGQIDWSTFEGVIVDSLEAKESISSLMQEPFCSVPLIWVIQEDTLASRLQAYEEKGWRNLISHWRSAFSRANIVVFPDFSLPMLYSVLDSGNFFVIPGSPIHIWAAEIYAKTHSKIQLREKYGFKKDDFLVLLVGSSIFSNELAWDYATAMHYIGPLLVKYARRKDPGWSFKFVFLCGNSTDGYNDTLREVASRLGLHDDSLRHYGLNSDVKAVMLMSDVVLYDSSHDVQGFPPLLIQAMTFEIPVIAPAFPALSRLVVDRVHMILIPNNNPDTLLKAFSLLISSGKLSKFAKTVASYGRLLAKNMLASECIIGYARLLENVINFPSDVKLPDPISQPRQGAWEWNLFRSEISLPSDATPNGADSDSSAENPSVVSILEEEFKMFANSKNISEDGTIDLEQDMPNQLDWDVLEEIESSLEYEDLEMEELEERMEKNYGVWDEIYRNARKSEKLKFETNERDEGELERIGRPVCIYEIYSGSAAWPFLHHGYLYRGLSLSAGARRSRSDDVNAVGRLPILNETYYRDILCGIGGMFAIAKKVDNIHGRPWIGFQSWHAAGRKVSLSTKAEKVLEETIQENTKGDVMYFWARLQIDGEIGSKNELTFWSMCDILNGGNCRTAFEEAFRKMYGLPSHIEALPPMPEDNGHWSALHSWVMPTPSFLEFVMFSRMFADSLDAMHNNTNGREACMLGSSELEKKHCYCRILEVLVNVWAYHSGRKMVYINPLSGSLEEQHPVERRRGFMWAKYFNSTLLKRMDEDLAEAADDGDHPSATWLWPLTGEVFWQGVYEREREQRYRFKMDKKRKTKEKLLERLKFGYKQKSLGG